MENYECKSTTPKKTLMSAVDKLTSTANIAEELERLSEKLIAKFERSENIPRTITNVYDGEIKCSQPDIIDLFNGVNTRLDLILTKIGSNMEKVINMVE